MKRYCLPLGAIVCVLAVVACGGGAPVATPAGPLVEATQTRAAELGQFATLTAPTPAPNVTATQTRAAELAQLATLSAPTATPNIAPTQTRAAELGQLATLTVPTATVRALPPATAATGVAAEAPASFVGRANGSDAFVAVVADGTRATAYVCDGKNLAAWFSGPVRDGRVELTNDEGKRLMVDLGRGAPGASSSLARGRVLVADGVELDFSTTLAASNGRAGLYRAVVGSPPPGKDEAPRVGVIVLDSGEFRGAYWADERATPVTEVRLGAGSLDATVPGKGTIAAARLGAPLGGRVERLAPVALVADQRRRGAPPLGSS